MNTYHKRAVRYLTHDEEITARMYGDEYTYRLRIWQGPSATPIVLVSATDDGNSINSIGQTTCKVANDVNECVLGHPIHGMIYYEYDGKTLCQVYFEFFGNSHRLRFFKPEKIAKPWSMLEAITGGKINR